jgi:hypothetical protein
MRPPIFSLVAGDSDCTTLLGQNPVRFFPFGEAPQHVSLPYATWQLITGVPENYIGCPPDIDSVSLQVDVWAYSQGDAHDVFDAIRRALETDAHIVGVNLEGREPDTRIYRISMTVDFWTERSN